MTAAPLAFATLATALFVSLGLESTAQADRLPKRMETRPARLDTAREKTLEGIAAGHGKATLAFPKGEPRLQKPFDAIVCLQPAKGGDAKEAVEKAAQSLEMKVVMPEHAHGMLVAPKRQAPRGACVVYTGLRVHMPGWWRFEFRGDGPQGPWKVTFDADVPAP